MNADSWWQQEMEQKLRQLEQTMEQLISEVRQLSKQEKTYVDKIEYKFDQLKVETVEGTLHIGVLPSTEQQVQTIPNEYGQVQEAGSAAETDGEVEKMGQNGFSGGPYDLQFSARAHTELYVRAKQRIEHYVKDDLHTTIRKLQDDYSCVLGEQYVSQMVQDIAMQSEGRLLYYLNQMNLPHDQHVAENEVVARTIKDIENALKQHIESIS